MVNTTAFWSPPKRHTLAWYSYAFAAEVFSACALAIFLPITLEQMAREVGFVAPDLTVPCGGASEEGVICKAKVLGSWVDTASFSMYVKSLAVAIQAVSIISTGPLADSPYWRKKLLLTFAYIGSLAGIALLLFPSEPASWIPVAAAGIMVVSNTGYAISIVCANAFLPGLAKEDPEVVDALRKSGATAENEQDEDDMSRGTGPRADAGSGGEEEQALLTSTLEPPYISSIATNLPLAQVRSISYGQEAGKYHTAILSFTMSRISSTGVAIGFFSGVAVLALLIIPVTLGGGSTASLRLATGLSGIWWAIFTLPSWIGLPGGTVLDGKSASGMSLAGAWKRVGRMVSPKEMRRLRNLYTFLLAWIFLSDGFHTTTYTAILYASSTLRLPPSKIILIGILVQLAAVVSSFYTPRIQLRKGYSNSQVLLRIVVLALILPIYTCVGLILPFGGLRTEGEMYVAATWFGLLYGPFNSYSRAVYAELIPTGHESTFFSLFALTDKSASFLGPFVVGLVADITGNIRLGFLFLLVMLVIPVPVLRRVDMIAGQEEARKWSGEIR